MFVIITEILFFLKNQENMMYKYYNLFKKWIEKY